MINEKYLKFSEFIDWDNPFLFEKALSISRGCSTDVEITKACFEFVRDEIMHSWDYKMSPVTYKASDVLRYGTGYCFAKSHLLAALLRANKIPAGLCYQRLALDNTSTYCLHGLNAVYLQESGWYRIDARGNKPGITAEFCPPEEKLAFKLENPGERDLPEIWTEPCNEVIKVLTSYYTIEQVNSNLPDVEILKI